VRLPQPVVSVTRLARYPTFQLSDPEVDVADIGTRPGNGQLAVGFCTECKPRAHTTIHVHRIPDKCNTFRIKYESCNNLLYKLALSPL